MTAVEESRLRRPGRLDGSRQPSPQATSLYGSPKIFPAYRPAGAGCWLTLVHGFAEVSSVSFGAILQAIGARSEGLESVLYFYGPGTRNCVASRGARAGPDAGRRGEDTISGRIAAFIDQGGTVYCCRLGLSLHGLGEQDLIEGVILCHPLDTQDALIHYARRGATINSTYMV